MLRRLMFTLLVGVSGLAQAQGDLLEQFMGDPRPAQAQFTQTDAKGTVTGEMTVGRQGFRWEQASPYPSLIVSNGKVAWQVDPDLSQATRMQVDPSQGWAGAFGDRNALEATYIVSQKGRKITLTPRDGNGAVGTIEFDAKGNPASATFGRGELDLDPHAITRIDFGPWTRLRGTTHGALFEYTPGAGMDVIGAD